MSHGLTSSDGMFTTRLPAWHKLGTVFEDYPTREEAQSLVHGWEPKRETLYRLRQRTEEITPGVQEVFESYEEVEGWVVNVRSDNDDVLGVVSESYTNVLNNELWDVAEALEGSGSDVMYETGGSLRGGAQVWVLLRLKEPLFVKGDPNGATIPYYALQNSHDGSGAFRGQATMTRIVCMNTARVADLDARARGTEFVFRHTKRVSERVEQARLALAAWRDSLEDWQRQTEYLLSLKTEPLAAQQFLERFIPMPATGTVSERVIRNVMTDRSKWLDAYNGVSGEGLKGTAYGLVQASVEYLNWGRRAHNAESLFRRTFLTKDAIVTRAVELALEAAHA